MSNESKALELAGAYADAVSTHRLECLYGTSKSYTLEKAKERDDLHLALIAELRRQHAEIESLRAQIEQKSERIAHLEVTASSNYGRGHADAHAMLSELPLKQANHETPEGWIGSVIVGYAKHHGGWCVFEETTPGEYVKIKGPFDTKELAQEAMRTPEPSQQAPVAQSEPVAWRYQDSRGNYRYRGYVRNFDLEYTILKPVPLYTHPQQAREPMTDEQKRELVTNWFAEGWAIKAALGMLGDYETIVIKGNQ